MLPAWAAEYVGIPFRSLGRDRDGIDCWGLYRMISAEHFGRTLRDFDIPADDTGLIAATVRRENDWTPVERPAPGDAALFRMGGALCHIGMVIAPGAMIHASLGRDVRVDRYDGPIWAPRLAGFYRP